MYEIIGCPGCSRQLRLPEELVGRDVVCPTCQFRFIAERAAPSALPEPPSQESPTDVEAEAFSPAPMAVSALSQGVQAEIPPVHLPTTAPTDRPITLHRSAAGKSLGRKILGVAVALALLGGVFAWIIAMIGAPGGRPRVVRVVEDDQERRQEVIEAFRGQKPLDVDEVTAELKPLFTALGEAYSAKDVRRIIGHFDLERMFDELAALEMLPANIRGDRRGFLKGVEKGMNRAAGQQAVFLHWTETEIRSVKKLQGNEAVVIARHRAANGIIFKMRWWVSKQTGAWRVFDYEDLDAGMRVTTLVGSIGQLGVAKAAGVAAAVQAVQQAAVATVERNPDAAERHLRRTDGVAMPRELEAMRSMVQGLIHLQRNLPKEALAAFDAAQGFNPDMPILKLLKASACNDLGQHAEALHHLEAYQALLGDDANTCVELGQALHGLQRIAEAQAAYRKALDYDAKNADAFLGLMRALGPDDPHEELATRFAKLDRPHENFDICAQDCRLVQDGAGLEQIALAMQKIDPGYEPVTYHLALGRLWLGKSAEAADLFKSVFSQEKNAVKRREYLDGYLQAMVSLGKTMEAYRALPDVREAFERLGAELQKSYRMDELRRLMAEHRKKHSDDLLLLLYQGQVHVDEGRYALADKAFTAAVAAKPPAGVLEPFEHSRIEARYHTGNGLAAWRDSSQRRQAFTQLANLCLGDDNDKLLKTLLDTHAKFDPQDTNVVNFRMRLAARQDEVEEAIRVFQAALAVTTDKEARDRLESDFAFALSDAGKPVEAYHALPDATRAFGMLVYDLRDMGNLAGLKKLIAAHRQRQPNDIALLREDGGQLLDEKKWDEAVRVFSEAMNKAPPDMRGQFRSDYLFAMHKAGRGLEVFQAEPDSATFTQLANLMAMDRQGKALVALVEAYRPKAKEDAHLVFYEIRAKAQTGQAKEALALLQRAAQQPGGTLLRDHLSNVLYDLDDAGQGIEAYRIVADKPAAFAILAGRLANTKKDKALAQLLDEHAKTKPADPWLEHYRGELLMLRGAAEQAAEHFAAAHRRMPVRDAFTTRNALFRASVKAGKTVATYREFGPGTRAFEDLARDCVHDKNAAQLAALVTAHRQADPEDPALAMWEIEIARLNHDDDAVLKLLDAHEKLLSQPRYRWQAHNHRVRCLIRKKQLPEALREAQAFAKKQRGPSVTLILAHAAQGDVKQTLATMESFGALNYFIGDCYHDPDLGPILRGVGFAAFRERYPESKEAGLK